MIFEKLSKWDHTGPPPPSDIYQVLFHGSGASMESGMFECQTHFGRTAADRPVLPASVEKTLLRRRTPLGKLACKNTKSGAAEQFLPLDCMAMAEDPLKGMFFQTPVSLALKGRSYSGPRGDLVICPDSLRLPCFDPGCLLPRNHLFAYD